MISEQLSIVSSVALKLVTYAPRKRDHDHCGTGGSHTLSAGTPDVPFTTA